MKIKFQSALFSTLTALSCYAQNNNTYQTKQQVHLSYQMQPSHMKTRWDNNVNQSNVLKEYPRPQLQRRKWQNLNGMWEYAITDSLAGTPNVFEGNILVPFPIESALSGVKKILLPEQRLWYRKIIALPKTQPQKRILLHFGAVDWEATVYINKKQVGKHTGGYQNFTIDITDFLQPGSNEILVRVYDPSDQGINPHGKQTLYPANIYYTASSGIWQTVWLETVPLTYITHLRTTPNIDKGTLQLDISTNGSFTGAKLEIAALANDKVVVNRNFSISDQEEHITIDLPNARLWSPDDPFLYNLSIKISKNGKTIDEVKSYFGMRKIDIQKDEKGADRIFLNNKYTFNLGVLDQGFWPNGLYTAPTDEALMYDIKTIKSLGFNTIRKHIKIEPERWYYHADKIGILVWQDFVNPSQGLQEGSKPVFEKEMQETIDQLYSHPSIVTWVLFNERWGAYDQKRLTEWIKKYDPSRIVNGHSGELLYVNNELRDPAEMPWVGSDMTDVHSYPEPRLPPAQPNKAMVLGEFGGLGVSVPDHEWDDQQGWGYVELTPTQLKDRYLEMSQKIKKLEIVGLSGSIYTQPFDVEGEENGLLTYDREIIKIPVNEIRSINQGLVQQTNGFTLDPHFVIATNIDTGNNDNRYEELLAEYKNGAKDSSFLRRLTLMAMRKKDQENMTNIGNSYIDILSQPFSRDNLFFILKITRTSKDKGFAMCWEQPKKIDEMIGQYAAIKKVRKVIDAEEIAPTYKKSPNWDAIQQRIINKYGDLGESYVFGRRMIYYGFESKDWDNYGKYYMLYFKKALTTSSEYAINNVTWVLYEHVTDPKVLEYATTVMKYAIDNNLDRSPEAYDTYANLLHRTNNSAEAIKWEEKALALKKGAPDEKLFAETLQKMKAGQPTWPQNN
ncbi:glycoside hydrolase family 2 [Chitinophaga polysaccharea]|uniref:glycoside hydrolase family 2 protein n=1 Tax=Chitinophaga polysaccharea TaxID=1293035 RepID=UPI0014554EA7|nr:sugar-binding domain-containing protein [Chitinophaga polysaccharea]NLR62307.1 glycoside hydrolase family 2 [Chitinophaga polysaccharea]